jgi:serine phosphatase RsbU (regulator of sigma subunit)
VKIETRQPKETRWAVLAIGLLSWLCLTGSWVSISYEGANLDPLLLSFCSVLYLLGFLLFSILLERRRDLRDPEILLRNLVWAGMGALAIILVPVIHDLFSDESSYFVQDVYPSIVTLPFVLFLTIQFAFYRQLIEQSNEPSTKLWIGFTALLLLSAGAAAIELSDWMLWIIYGAGAALALPQMTRLRWIADLNRQSRIYALSYLFLLGVIVASLALYFYQTSSQSSASYISDLYHSKSFAHPFHWLLLGFSGFYSVTSFLALVFHWPISDVVEKRNLELASLHDLHDRINRMSSSDEITELLFQICCDNSEAQAGWLTRPLDGVHQIQFLKKGDISIEQIGIWEESIRKTDKQNGTPPKNVGGYAQYMYFRDARRHIELKNLGKKYPSVLSFPMTFQGKGEGSLVLLKENENAFNQHDLRVLETYVNQAKLALEKNRLVSVAVEDERMRNDFEIAVRVQNALLPKQIPSTPWMKVAHAYMPASEVGGDYYDFSEGTEQLHLVVGDVTGHGIGAAFNVAELKGIFHSNKDFVHDPEEFLMRVNDVVKTCFDSNIFLTMAYLGFHPERQSFTYARAGHCPILYYHSQTEEIEYLPGRGLGLGIIGGEAYREHIEVLESQFISNDVMVLYTDGIIEAKSLDGEEYGQDRLLQLVRRHVFFKASEIKDRILVDVQNFMGVDQAEDDITLIVIKFK